jgi:cell division protein FtsB
MSQKLKKVPGVSTKARGRVPGKDKRAATKSEAVAARQGAQAERTARRRVSASAARAGAKAPAKAPAARQPRRGAEAAPRKQAKVEAAGSRGKQEKKPRRERAAAKVKETTRKPLRERFSLRSVTPRAVILFILFAVFIALSASPVARNMEATGHLKAMERELTTQQKTTAALESEVKAAQSLGYVEQEARRQRLVAPGEVLYLVTTDSKEPTVEYRLKALQSMDEAWESVRQALHCTASRQVNGK